VARAAVPAALAAAAIAVSGCTISGSQDSADLVNGKQLFAEKCGSCHVLDRAGTKGVTGPNLDEAFVVARNEGWGEESIRGVVLGQILYPGKGLTMPAELVTGEDAEDVAAYVAATAGLPGKDEGLLATAVQAASGPQANTAGGKLFAENCGSCHTLTSVGTTGTTGPKLDQTKLDAAAIETQIANGKGAMPGFAGQIPPADIKTIAEVLAAQASS
jgi:mono/diheme cytochrome c family protein